MTGTRRDEMYERCSAFHRAHPEVWEMFEYFALQKIADGKTHYGAKAVMERVRWDMDIGGDSPDLKFNNNFATFYGRRFARRHPKHADFFRFRVQTSEQRPATQRPEPRRDSFVQTEAR